MGSQQVVECRCRLTQEVWRSYKPIDVNDDSGDDDGDGDDDDDDDSGVVDREDVLRLDRSVLVVCWLFLGTRTQMIMMMIINPDET